MYGCAGAQLTLFRGCLFVGPNERPRRSWRLDLPTIQNYSSKGHYHATGVYNNIDFSIAAEPIVRCNALTVKLEGERKSII